jgi:N-acetylglucosamine malate deacetylase 1
MILVAFGAHPDDIELGAGATLAAAAAHGHQVMIVDLTRGERASAGTPAIRAREARAAARALGVERRTLGFPDTGLSRFDREQERGVIAAIRSLRPHLVLAPTGRDRHPDHVEAHHLVRRAAYLAGLMKVDPESGPPHRPAALLFYPSSREPLAHPHLVIDVSATIGQKMKALAAYKSQFVRRRGGPATPLNVAGFLARVRARAEAAGLEVEARFGEAFLLDRPLKARDPFLALGEWLESAPAISPPMGRTPRAKPAKRKGRGR